MIKTLFCLIAVSLSLQAADGWLGTWKLDPSRSQFQNTDVLKDMLLVISEEGNNQVLTFTMTMADGKVEHQAIKQPIKGGKLIPIGNTPVENGVLEVPNDHEWVYKYYSNDGKLESTRYVKLSKDGKSHEADMRGMSNAKKMIEHEYMIKQ